MPRKKKAGEAAEKSEKKESVSKPGEKQAKAGSKEKRIPEINIGLIGHVDHGKTSLTQALTGKWTDTHSEEIKRGITIRLGYADASFFYCSKCKKYSSSKKCPSCFSDSEYIRTVSFVDAPGHETLMATVLSGASLMDAAILLVAANEECPQPQTIEHLKVLDISGIKNIIIVQNKIDLVTADQARKNYGQIKEFVKGSIAESAPVIPVSAAYSVNIDILIEEIERVFKTPERNENDIPKFLVARSFDVNRPGTHISKLSGGVIGGSLVKGVLKQGDGIEIIPGFREKDSYFSVKGKITGFVHGSETIDEAKPGGLLAIQTDIDPYMAKNDSLSGNVAFIEGRGSEARDSLKVSVNLFDHVIGLKEKHKVEKIRTNDVLMLTSGIAKTVGTVQSVGNYADINVKIPVVAEKGEKISLSKQLGSRWHLIGWGEVVE